MSDGIRRLDKRPRTPWEASVNDARTNKKTRNALASYEEARQWRASMLLAVRSGAVRAVAKPRLRDAA